MQTQDDNVRDKNLEKIRQKADEMGVFLNDAQTIEIWMSFGDEPAAMSDIGKKIRSLEDDGWEIPDDDREL